jgi:hypothetical protein
MLEAQEMGRFRFRTAFMTLVLVLSSTAWVSPAHAESTAACVASWRITFSPGVTSESGKVSFTSHGQTGTILCDGPVGGQRVMGPGTIGEEGALEGSCAAGSGTSLYSFTLPTSSGPLAISAPITFTYGPGAGVQFADQIPGSFQFVATKGDCITAPITEAVTTVEMLLKS